MVKLLFGYCAKVTVFREELAQESIEVLVATSLPTVVGMGKVHA